MERYEAIATGASRMYGMLRPQNIEENQEVTGEIHHNTYDVA
jgi:hypothetical protein